MGFEVAAEVLNTANYGVAQTRKRTIIVGWLLEEMESPDFPPPRTHADPATKTDLAPWRTVRDVIADLPAKAIGTKIGDTFAAKKSKCVVARSGGFQAP